MKKIQKQWKKKTIAKHSDLTPAIIMTAVITTAAAITIASIVIAMTQSAKRRKRK